MRRSSSILSMIRYLHTLSAALFYILGSAAFIAYVMQTNNIAVAASTEWLNASDLPLLCIGLLYGGLSLYRSLTNENKASRTLGLSIGIPLLILFLLFVSLKFFVHSF